MPNDWRFWLALLSAAILFTVVLLRRLGRDRRERDRLQRQVRELDQFTRTVAHDLRGPLATLRVLLKRIDASSADLEQVRRLASQAENLVQLLLTLARAGDVVSTPATVSFTEITREAWDALTLGTDRHEQLTIAADLPVVHGDRLRLRQVMQNLLENALQATGDQPHPRIVVGCQTDASEPVYFVEDNGRGFQHGTDPLRCRHGWGLKIVQQIIAAHGGRLWIEPQSSGCRVCFTVYAATVD